MASMPFTFGIPRSIRITSGCNLAASRIASSPSVASPTTSMSEAESKSARNPSRKCGWSSAMSRRTDSTLTAPMCQCGVAKAR